MSLAVAEQDAVGPLSRDAFEAACTRSGVLRVFAHGTYSKADAPLSGIILDEATDAHLLYQGYEITTMDLRGCGRVELWACESGVQIDYLGLLLGNDEPLGIASSFLLAGARVVLGSIWKQPAMAAALIAIAFAGRAGAPGSAERDAASLASAIRAYRDVVDEDSVFERTLRRSLAASLMASPAGEGHVARAMQAAWSAATSTLGGKHEAVLPWTAVKDFEGLDERLLAEAREVVNDPDERDHELIRCARRLTEELRSPVSWAGWRVLARDKSVL